MKAVETYVDKFWYNRDTNNQQTVYNILLEMIEDGYDPSSLHLTKELVKRGCTPEYKLTLSYD